MKASPDYYSINISWCELGNITDNGSIGARVWCDLNREGLIFPSGYDPIPRPIIFSGEFL